MAKMNLAYTIMVVVIIVILVTSIFGFLNTYPTWEERRENLGKFLVSLGISLLIIAGIYYVVTRLLVVRNKEGEVIVGDEHGWWSGLKRTYNDNSERSAVGKAAYEKTYAVAYGDAIKSGSSPSVAKASAKRAAEGAKQNAVADAKAAQRADKDPSRYGGSGSGI